MSKHCCDPEPHRDSHSPLHDHAHGHDHAHDHGHDHGDQDFNLKQEILQIAVVAALFIVGFTFEQPLHSTPFSVGEYAVLIPAYLIGGWGVLKSAGRNILRGQVFDENFLMAIATLGAVAIHKIPEAVAVMLFFRVGELFQDFSVSRSRRSIKALLEVRPDSANLKVEGEVRRVSPAAVEVGEQILVRPGEKIPLDGEVVEGSSQVDTSALTGESVPRTVTRGATVLAGMMNQSGVLSVQVTRRFEDSSIAKIVDLVENASSKKAQAQKFITQFARIYTPVVVFASLAVALIPPLVLPGATSAEWIYRALILLVISCPCGLVISIPLGYFGGVGGAAKRGILVKGATFLDALTAVNIVVFDKTGTLTQGVFRVTEVIAKNGVTQDQLLALAAKAEAHSNHPIARSIRAAYGHAVNEAEIEDYTEVPGYGIRATVNGQSILAGNDRFLVQQHIAFDPSNSGGTVVHFAADRHYIGYILIADSLKEDAVEAVQSLRRLGVKQISMLTGDNQAAASGISHQLGLSSYRADLLPEQKLKALEDLLAARAGNRIVFVGDGINDAPVIARADVGIAMGGLGSDAAIETADVVIMNDSPAKVAEAIQIARKTRRIVWQNIIFAIAVKGVFIGLGIFGIATLWEAVFADVGVALAAIFNATRVLKLGKL